MSNGRAPADTAPGYDARARLAKLEELAALQDRLLRQAAERIEALEQREPARSEPSYVPIKTAAASSGLSVRTLKRLIQRRAVAGRAVRLTGAKRCRWVVDADSLRAFLPLVPATESAAEARAGESPSRIGCENANRRITNAERNLRRASARDASGACAPRRGPD